MGDTTHALPWFPKGKNQMTYMTLAIKASYKGRNQMGCRNPTTVGSQMERNQMGYATLAVPGSPNGKQSNGIHNPCHLKDPK